MTFAGNQGEGAKIGNRKIENAKGLYLEGIRDGNIADALQKYTGDRYIQHSTGVGDGKEGFAAFFAPFVERNPVRQIEVVRAIEDGPFVFLHVYQNLNNGAAQWVTADLFDTDHRDRMIEHWDVIQACVEGTRPGRSMVDGPTKVTDLDKTEDNKTSVREFFDVVLLGGDLDRIADYVSPDHYAQHNPSTDDGLDGFVARMKDLEARGTPLRHLKLHKLIGQGNFVVTLSQVRIGTSQYAVFDIFRLQHGLIVEHWDVSEKILPPEQWNNTGKF